MKLLLHPAVEDERLDKICAAANPMQVVNAIDENDALIQIVDADAFFGKITSELLAQAKKLRWVQSPTASLEHYLFPELIEHPCRLSNMRGLFSDIIADHVMGLTISLARNLHTYIRQQLQAKWEPVGGEAERSNFTSGPGVVNAIDRSHIHLADCTMGVVGVGSIGSEICRRAQAFGMKVIGVDPVCRQVPGIVEEVWPIDQLSTLLAESDFVVIAAPHTPATFKLFKKEQFSRMKNSAYLINIGRGVIVDLADLTTALESKEIAGAAFDVFEIEPLPADHPLWKMENVIITPHVAAVSTHIAERHLATLLENIRRFVAGEDPITLVDKQQWF